MSFEIKRPLSPSERILIKKLERATAIAASYVGDNIILRAKHRQMIEGQDWRRRLARWLILAAEKREARRAGNDCPPPSENAAPSPDDRPAT